MAHQQLTQVKRQFMESKKQLQDKVAALEAKVIAVETARDFDKKCLRTQTGKFGWDPGRMFVSLWQIDLYKRR